MENNLGGKLVVAEARMGENKTGVSGDGALFNVKFRVIGAQGSGSNISVGNESFLADISNDLVSQFSNAQISVQITVTGPVQNLLAREGAVRYEIALSWQTPADSADKYKVFRKKFNGDYVELGETNNLEFVDSDAIAGGGKIVPGIAYEYRVRAVKNGIESVDVNISQIETRGIKGDNNRTDRVDGRDLENLARHFAETGASVGYNPLVDTTYDGRIDGGDLIDIGASWALTYLE
ncbi:MAG: fibronectin type III domain-containing protein [Patescibacteria group bacterium]